MTVIKPSHFPFTKNALGQNSCEHVKRCKLLYECVFKTLHCIEKL